MNDDLETMRSRLEHEINARKAAEALLGRVVEHLSVIADPKNVAFAGDVQMFAREMLQFMGEPSPTDGGAPNQPPGIRLGVRRL